MDWSCVRKSETVKNILKVKSLGLLLIDVQKGFLDSNYWGQRNNPDFETNIKALLTTCRRLNLPIIHIQHLSTEEKSPLRPGQEGVDFMPEGEPQFGERIFQKKVNSAFIGTQLEEYLRSTNIHSLIVAGLTTDHCVSTTVRMAANFDFQIYLVADCTATFERKGIDSTYPAHLVHDVSLASLKDEFATIVSKEEISTLSISAMSSRQSDSLPS